GTRIGLKSLRSCAAATDAKKNESERILIIAGSHCSTEPSAISSWRLSAGPANLLRVVVCFAAFVIFEALSAEKFDSAAGGDHPAVSPDDLDETCGVFVGHLASNAGGPSAVATADLGLPFHAIALPQRGIPARCRRGCLSALRRQRASPLFRCRTFAAKRSRD